MTSMPRLGKSAKVAIKCASSASMSLITGELYA